jgi:hypothetical protein
MIRFQIIEKSGANLFKTLVRDMREGNLRTFVAKKRGRKVQHTNKSYPGWMNWSEANGVINCEVISPNKPGREWLLFSAFLGRLADRYSDHILAINIQFPSSEQGTEKAGKRRKRRFQNRSNHRSSRPVD